MQSFEVEDETKFPFYRSFGVTHEAFLCFAWHVFWFCSKKVLGSFSPNFSILCLDG